MPQLIDMYVHTVPTHQSGRNSSGHHIVGPVGPFGHLHLWSDSGGLYLQDQMSDRRLERLYYVFGHNYLIIHPTKTYD